MPLSLDGGLCLRPGGAGPNKNPFAGFGKGAGASLPKKTQEAGPLREERKKAPGDIIKYTDDFLLKFREMYMTAPPELAGQQELLMDSPGATKPAESAETPLPRQPEQADTRDWHTRKELPPAPENQREQQQQQSEFAKRAAHVGQGIHNTAQNLKKLAQLAKRTGKFDDPAMEIANLSRVIKEDIQALNVALVDLQNLSAASRVTNKQSSSHSHTVVDNLRLRLKDTTKEFQNVLQVRKENLEKNKTRQQQFSSAPDRNTFSTARPGLPGQGASFLPAANGATSGGFRAPASSQHLFGGLPPGEMGSSSGSREQSAVSEQCVSPLNPPSSSAVATAKQSLRHRTNSSSARPSRLSSDEQELVEEQIHRQPLLQQDQQLVVRQDTYLDSRAAALQNVESTIHELGGIFQQLAHMVQEQGELAIRIDENVDETLANVDSAQAQLLKYLNTISSNRWLVMKIFMVLLVFLVIFVVFIA